MRIAHIILPGASEYEQKSQRADFAALSGRHEVVVASLEDVRGADVAHVYASGELPSAAFVKFPIPYVASLPMQPSKWSFWRKPVAPSIVVSPFGDTPLPEAVEDAYFDAPRHSGPGQNVVGFFAREASRNLVEQTRQRIERFRSDISWKTFRHAPSTNDLMAVDIWVDPAMSDSDLDGFTAEALVLGLPVVATRTAMNGKRLEQGRTGFLVPPGDPNEMTHAILAALFKQEVADSKKTAAAQTVSKYRARQRLRVLAPLYDTLIS